MESLLSKVVLTFESLGGILKCDHSNERYWAVLSCGTVYYALKGGSNFWVCGWNPKVWPFKWKLSIEQYCAVLLFIILYKVILTFEPLGKIVKCDHSVESYLAPWDSSKSEYYSATFMVKLRCVIYMGAFDWSYSGIRIRKSFLCYKSLLPRFLDHLNSAYIGIFYLK